MKPSTFLGIIISTTGILGVLLLPFSFFYGIGLIALSAATARMLANRTP